MSSQYLMDSSLSQDVSQFDFSTPVQVSFHFKSNNRLSHIIQFYYPTLWAPTIISAFLNRESATICMMLSYEYEIQTIGSFANREKGSSFYFISEVNYLNLSVLRIGVKVAEKLLIFLRFLKGGFSPPVYCWNSFLFIVYFSLLLGVNLVDLYHDIHLLLRFASTPVVLMYRMFPTGLFQYTWLPRKQIWLPDT